MARDRWSVVLERTVRELQGESCISLEDQPDPKKQIAYTRSFGQAISDLPSLIEAISEFASRAAEKLRNQNSHAAQLYVFAHTSPFRPGPRFSNWVTVPLRRPTSDTMLLVQAAVAGVRSIYKPGFQLAKAGVMLMELARGTRLGAPAPCALRVPEPLVKTWLTCSWPNPLRDLSLLKIRGDSAAAG